MREDSYKENDFDRSLDEIEKKIGSESIRFLTPAAGFVFLTKARVSAALEAVMTGRITPDVLLIASSLGSDCQERGFGHQDELIRVMAAAHRGGEQTPTGEHEFDKSEGAE